MLKIRLQRVGKRNDPLFRVVVTDSKKGPKSGNNVELLGSYNPHANSVQVKGDRVQHWMSMGAQVSDTVHNLLVSEKIIEGKKINVLPKKSPVIDEEKLKAEAEAKAAAEAEAAAAKEAEAAKTAQEEAPVAEEAEPPKEEVKEEVRVETETEETETPTDTEEAPKEDTKTEEPKEEVKETEATAEEEKKEV